MIPTKEEALHLLEWAGKCNPGSWVDHSKVVARIAENISLKCGLDIHRAYVSGLLHDIGRYAGVRDLYHVYAGHKLLNNEGYNEIAEICLSHSFPYQDIDEYFGKIDCSPEEAEVITSFLSNTTYNDYDKLIQLCDAIGTSEGASLIEVRIMDVIRRNGLAKLTVQKIDALFETKKYFDKLCDMNIYDLFYDEVRDISFR